VIYSSLIGRRVEAMVNLRPRGTVVGVAADPNGFSLLILDDNGEMNDYPAVSCRVLPDEPTPRPAPTATPGSGMVPR